MAESEVMFLDKKQTCYSAKQNILIRISCDNSSEFRSNHESYNCKCSKQRNKQRIGQLS